MILLVHSCDSRSWIWEYWWRFFDRSGWNIDVRFITGKEEFSDQLIKELSTLSNEYLWYTLDDYFIVEPIEWAVYESIFRRWKMDCLRLQPNVVYASLPYRFERIDWILKQAPESEYHVSMSTSIWRREYFLSCLKPGLNPWQTELERPEKLGDVYFVPELPFWYINGTIKGQWTEAAKKII